MISYHDADKNDPKPKLVEMTKKELLEVKDHDKPGYPAYTIIVNEKDAKDYLQLATLIEDLSFSLEDNENESDERRLNNLMEQLTKIKTTKIHKI